MLVYILCSLHSAFYTNVFKINAAIYISCYFSTMDSAVGFSLLSAASSCFHYLPVEINSHIYNMYIILHIRIYSDYTHAKSASNIQTFRKHTSQVYACSYQQQLITVFRIVELKLI